MSVASGAPFPELSRVPRFLLGTSPRKAQHEVDSHPQGRGGQGQRGAWGKEHDKVGSAGLKPGVSLNRGPRRSFQGDSGTLTRQVLHYAAKKNTTCQKPSTRKGVDAPHLKTAAHPGLSSGFSWKEKLQVPRQLSLKIKSHVNHSLFRVQNVSSW